MGKVDHEDQTRIYCLVTTYDDYNKDKSFAFGWSFGDHGDKYLVRQWFTDETFNADQEMRQLFASNDQNRIFCLIVVVLSNLNDHDGRLLQSLKKINSLSNRIVRRSIPAGKYLAELCY